ncbi:MAG: glutamine-hydrolyzing carbamoyl-phosphate synthase small subunit [Planctomycetes bacterium]|nr:glutamine-hydrolyzing carbamoyl-phosphate synthase small subunit [Planctomycetota bacterium]
MKKRTPGILLLEDGRAFKGRLFGAEKKRFGEVVFNTALTGYQEVVTDPSYAGQIVTLTATQIGNYGINTEDNECERPWLSGLVIRELSAIVSNFRSERTLDDFLRAHGVPGIDNLDTRALTLHLRTHGAMRGVIADAGENAERLLDEVLASPKMEGQDLVKEVSAASACDFSAGYESAFSDQLELPAKRPERAIKCAAIDYGAKQNILRGLVQSGFNVRVFPARAKVEEILAWGPEAVFLSNGPGDPAALPHEISVVKTLIAKKLPIFGICLGHQLLTWAMGGKTYKLKFGHHAANHPVKENATGKVEITSQNHGFATDPKSLPSDVEVTHMNINDNTVSGIRHKTLPIFGVQYHPEASPGPHDSLHLFRRFYRMALETLTAKV